MRDLAKDLEICRAASPGPWAVKPNYGLLKSEICTDKKAVATVWTKRQAVTPDGKNIIIADETGEANAQFVAAAQEGWPHAIERAIKAEAEVERLRENLCGACESLTQATGHGWKDTCCNCEWYKTDRVTRESEGE